MPTATGILRQAATIALHEGRICLITSRSGKRWVIPKGCLEPGMTAGELALQEAWEEAGITGVLQPDPLGTYVYEKSGFTCHVTVFQLQVTKVVDDWPERSVRERRWLSPEQALAKIEEAGLRDLIRGALAARAG